jgi:hypothetical protein
MVRKDDARYFVLFNSPLQYLRFKINGFFRPFISCGITSYFPIQNLLKTDIQSIIQIWQQINDKKNETKTNKNNILSKIKTECND